MTEQLQRQIDELRVRLDEMSTQESHNFFLNVRYFGAVGDGTTDDTIAIQAALDAAASMATGYNQGTTVLFPSGNYVVTSPLNLCNRSDIKLLGQGGRTYTTVIIGKTTGKAVIEMLGTTDVVIEGIAINGHATSTPAIGIWSGRSSVRATGYRIYYRDVYMYGSFSLACWLNCGSESNIWDECFTYPSNSGCDAGILFDYRNAISGITPDNATINTTYDTALCEIRNSHLTCNSTATSFIPIYIYAGNGPKISKTYLVSWGQPIIYLRGGCSGGELVIEDAYIEGTPTYIIRGTVDGTYNVSNNRTEFSLTRTGAGGSTASIYFDNNSTVANSFIIDCDLRADIQFYDINGCYFNRWGVYSNVHSPTMTIVNDVVNSYIHINFSDALTIGGYAYNSVIDDDSSVPSGGYTLIANKGFRVDNVYDGATAANITRILTASTTWDPGSLADGESTHTNLALSGVAVDGTWVCWASLSTMAPSRWEISAYPYAGGVYVTITNRTGGTVDLSSGTLRIVAMKVA